MKLKYGEPDAGFSLIEIIVSITVLAIAMTAIYQGLTDAITKNYEARDLQKATFEAESVLETLQAEGIAYQEQDSDVRDALQTRFSSDLFVVTIEGKTANEDDAGNVTGGYDIVIEHLNKDKTRSQFRLVTYVPAVPAEGGGAP